MSIQKVTRMNPVKALRKTAKCGSVKCKTTKVRRVARAILEEAKTVRKSRRIYDLDYNYLSQFFHMPQKTAAKMIGVAPITVKRNCKRYGFEWPYRANKYKLHAQTLAATTKGAKPKKSTKPQAAKPMQLMTEAARAFSRLPADCMEENRKLLAEMEDTVKFDGVSHIAVIQEDETEGVGRILVSLQRCSMPRDML